MNREYWRKAGNPRWGWYMLSQDIKNHLYGGEQRNRDINNSNPIQPRNPENNGAPQYNTYINNYPSNSPNQVGREFHYMRFWKTIATILIMTLITITVYYVCFKPDVIIQIGRRAMEIASHGFQNI